MEYEPREGVDYIVDLYAIVGVDNDAAEVEIKQNVRERLREYHPDRLERVAPEFKSKGEIMTKLLNRANVILLDTEKRNEYDEILAVWTGPVSKEGTPVIQADRLLQAEFQDKTPEEVETTFAGYGEKVSTMLGYSPSRLGLLRKMIEEAGGEATDELRTEYEAALLQHDQVLSIQEAERSELLGLPDIANDRHAAQKNYAELISGRIETARTARKEELQRLALGGVSTRLALLSGEATSAAEHALAPATSSLELPAYFDTQAAKIQEIAVEREKLLEERLVNFSPAYPLAEMQTELKKNLAIGIEVKSGVAWYKIELADGQADISAVFPDDIQSALEREAYANVIEQGYNVLTFKLMEQISPEDLLKEAIGKHVNKYNEEPAPKS